MKTEYLDRANRIATDNVSSAQQILKETLDLLLDMCEKHSSEAGFESELKSISSTLSNAQSQMAALSNISRLIVAALDRIRPQEIRPYMVSLHRKVDEASARTAEHASGLITDRHSYATLSQSEFVTRSFEAAAAQGKLATIYVMESRPLFEGRQTAKSLTSAGHEAILVSDASIGSFIDEIDAAFVGADAILSDGTLVNKIGSFALAAACKIAGKEFHAMTSVLKYDGAKRASGFVNKEESPHEIHANPEFEVRNYYFDLVAPELITSVITEAGGFSLMTGLAELEAALTRMYG